MTPIGSGQTAPQDLVIFQCAFVVTNEGTARRPRLLILSAPTVEGADPVKIVEQWLTAARAANSFPVIHDLHSNTGFELGAPGAAPMPARPAPLPSTPRVNEELAAKAVAAHPPLEDAQ